MCLLDDLYTSLCKFLQHLIFILFILIIILGTVLIVVKSTILVSWENFIGEAFEEAQNTKWHIVLQPSWVKWRSRGEQKPMTGRGWGCRPLTRLLRNSGWSYQLFQMKLNLQRLKLLDLQIIISGKYMNEKNLVGQGCAYSK